MTMTNGSPEVINSVERAVLGLLSNELINALCKFAHDKITGQITLNIKDGKVKAIDIRETVRVSS